MATIRGYIRKVQQLDVDQASKDAMLMSLDGYIDQQKRQLYQGFNKKQTYLIPYAWPWYAKKKNKMNSNPGYGNPDLFLKGDFYNGLEAKLNGEAIVVDSTDEKGPMLKEKYDPFGLGGSFKVEFVTLTLRPNYLKIIKIRMQ